MNFSKTITRLLLIFVALLLYSTTVWAESNISGIIKDESGETIIGESATVELYMGKYCATYTQPWEDTIFKCDGSFQIASATVNEADGTFLLEGPFYTPLIWSSDENFNKFFLKVTTEEESQYLDGWWSSEGAASDGTGAESISFSDDEYEITLEKKEASSDSVAKLPGQSCGTNRILDCNLKCVEEKKVNKHKGNGICDLNTLDINLQCEAFEYDGGDCDVMPTPGDSCGSKSIYDCALNCVKEKKVDKRTGNGLCDNSESLLLNCETFDYDEGDCEELEELIEYFSYE